MRSSTHAHVSDWAVAMLGVSLPVTETELTTALRKRSLEISPDMTDPLASAKLMLVRAAYQHLLQTVVPRPSTRWQPPPAPLQKQVVRRPPPTQPPLLVLPTPSPRPLCVPTQPPSRLRRIVVWMVPLAILFLVYHGLKPSSDEQTSNSKPSVVQTATPISEPTSSTSSVDASRLVTLLFAVPFARNDSGQIWLKNDSDTTRTWVEPKDLENWLKYGWRSAVDLSLCSFDMPFQCAEVVGNRTLVDGAGQPSGCSKCCLDLESTEVRHCATWTLSGRKVLQQRQEGRLEVLATDEKTVVGFITHNAKGQLTWTPKRRSRPRQKCDPVLRDGATTCQSNDQCVAPVKCVRGLCCGL